MKQGIQISFFPPEYNRITGDYIARLSHYNLKGNLHGEQHINYPTGGLKALFHYENGKLVRKASLWRSGRKGELDNWEYRKGKLVSRKKKAA
jgi:antitoxin component YwqK of YwqJK toxin-antitoxin module